MKTNIPVNLTRHPSLTRAVIKQFGDSRDRFAEVVNHGADIGFCGFTYYTETCRFFKAHKAEIMARLIEDAHDMHATGDPFSVIADFVCLRDLKLNAWQVSEAINGRGEDAQTVQNSLAWYALEEVARELNPDL